MKAKLNVFGFITIIFLILSCENNQTKIEANEAAFINTLENHLNAVTEKNLKKLKSTLSPEGDFLLILPNGEPSRTTTDFIDMHTEWFQDTSWTFDTKIVYTNIVENMGIALVEIMYQEPNRNGRPYFNKMAVTYCLKKNYDVWYVIADHASTIEKTSS